jgi:uncharacterized protein
MRWRELRDDLLGRSDRIAEPLQLQLAPGIRMLDALLQAVAEEHLDTLDVGRIQELEDEADDALDRVLALLGRTLSTPIDREDLFRLSRSLDDVVDNVRDFAVEATTYGVSRQQRFVRPLEALRVGCDALLRAVEQLPRDVDGLADAARKAKHANDTRDAYHEEMARLLSEELSMSVIRDRELLRRLDVAGLRLGEAADALASGALKRS